MSNVRLTTCSGLCLLVMLCAAGSVRADWTYEYADDFATGKAALDGYRHSAFWSKERAPLPEPYLYYIEIDRNRGLAFADYKGQNAELGYRFPLTSTPAVRTVKGVFALDVSFPSNPEISQAVPGRLECRTSPDGMGWSTAQVLGAGRHEIPITSAGGVCYILFSGTRVVIDNIDVSLNSTPVTIRVPQSFATIQAAIDAAGDGDVIEVAKGVYSGPGNRDIDFRGKAVTVRGAAGAKDTIIDCGGSAAKAEGGHRGFYLHLSEGADSVLSDLTIRGGRVFGSQIPPDPPRWTASAAHPVGGGIYCEFSSPTIANCIIQDCGAELGGGIGGVAAQPMIEDCVIEECITGGLGTAASGGRGGAIGLIGNSNATITNCIIRGNSGYYGSYGAGLYFQQSTGTVVGCTISDNTAFSVRGGGAYCGGATTDVTFRNCILSKNRADAGAGICAEWVLDASLSPAIRSKRCRLSVVNCTIARNELSGPTLPGAAAVQSSGAEVVVTSSILWANKGKALVITDSPLRDAVTYCDIEGGYSGPGNINADPLFASLDPEDYHLKSKYGRYDPGFERWVSDTVHSPCIDTGDPSASVGEEPPPNGNRINMGVYGGTKQASHGPEHFTYHVDGSSGRDWNTGLSHEQAFVTVQHAIDAARDGDTVLVWPGTYREQLRFMRKAITVQSAADAAVLTSPDYAVSFYSAESSRSVLANFVISGCSGAGVFCSSASPTLRNLTIVGNGRGIEAYDGSDPNITNCILWGNSGQDLNQCKARYSNIQDNVADTKVGNMQRDPMFADPQRGDYHLKSRAGRYVPLLDTWVTDSVTSPCIDAGNPKDDYRGERMPNGGRIDMGAHGGTPFASCSG